MNTSPQLSPFKGLGPCLRDRGESRIIAQIRETLADATLPSPFGMGDDCAVLPASAQSGPLPSGLVTVDALTLGEHFTADCPPALAGRKLVQRNVSDIAAMGGRPQWALLTLLTGGNLQLAWLDAFIAGIRDAAMEWNMRIVGGDLSTLPDDLFSSVLAVHGNAQTPILRSTAKVGDAIWVTGSLGGSLYGHHLTFSARVEEGVWLAQNVPISAMMDISDGLAKDLPALIPKGLRAELELEKIPISTAARRKAENQPAEALRAAFCDGEDYELLFCTPPHTHNWLSLWQKTFPQTPLTCIGHLVSADTPAANGSHLVDASTGTPLTFTNGYEHFRSG
jgi:thiamine-monophosphate kinase